MSIRVLTFADKWRICHDMTMPRLKKMTSLALDPELLDRLDAWLEAQSPRVSKTAALEAALAEFLDRREAPPAPKKRER